MNIHQQSDFILAHPFFEDAINDHNNGDSKKIVDLLNRLQLHCIDTQIRNSVKEYGSCKHMNTMDIKDRLMAMKQPENMNIYLPIPLPKAECKVINLITHIKKKAAKYFNPLQLSLFPDFPLQANLTH